MSGRSDQLSVPYIEICFGLKFDSQCCSIKCESLLTAGPLPLLGDIEMYTVDVTNQLKHLRLINLLVQTAFQIGELSTTCGYGCNSYHLETFYSGTRPKNVIPELNHFRHVVLTSIIMKCFERLILSHPLPYVQYQLDPYQFTCRSRRGTDNGVACLLRKLFEHMETAARILFINCSSAFNTIQRHVMIDKLQKLEVPAALVHWVLN